ncbi:MAG: hypothetical protein AB1486_14725 [Planctomycetota bacterium]
MERREFMRGVLGAAAMAAIPATVHADTRDDSTSAAGHSVNSDSREIELVRSLRRPAVRDLIDGYVFHASSLEQIHINKLSLLALGRSSDPQALEHLLAVSQTESSPDLRRTAEIQVYRFERRLREAPRWAILLGR